MTDKPIPFSAPMVRALLDGRKTMTRRVLKRPADHFHRSYTEAYINIDGAVIWWNGDTARNVRQSRLPYAVGDLLWVKEAWRTEARFDPQPPRDVPRSALVSYEADYTSEPNDGCRGRYRHGRFMPRWANRITLEVTAVRVERLQDISEEDAKAEGVERDSDGWRDYLMPSTQCCATARESFRTLWTSLHGPGAWEATPWVAVIELKRKEGDA